jgi:hypothetical protein
MKGDPMKKLSDEALKGMSDGELRTAARRLETRAGKQKRGTEDTRALEEEICYIQRELELRRRFGHMRVATQTQNDEKALEFEQA